MCRIIIFYGRICFLNRCTVGLQHDISYTLSIQLQSTYQSSFSRTFYQFACIINIGRFNIIYCNNYNYRVHRAHLPTMCEYYTFGIILKPFAYYQKNRAFSSQAQIKSIIIILIGIIEGNAHAIQAPYIKYWVPVLDVFGALQKYFQKKYNPLKTV